MVPYYFYLLGAVIALISAIDQCYGQEDGLEVLYEWRSADYLWPSESARDEAIKRKQYIPGNIVLLDVDQYDPMVHNVVCKEKPTSHTCAKIKKRTFVTSPRVNRGIPVVLSTISDRVRNGQHLLKPFPDWHYNREGNCDGLTSVFRTQEISRIVSCRAKEERRMNIRELPNFPE